MSGQESAEKEAKRHKTNHPFSGQTAPTAATSPPLGAGGALLALTNKLGNPPSRKQRKEKTAQLALPAPTPSPQPAALTAPTPTPQAKSRNGKKKQRAQRQHQRSDTDVLDLAKLIGRVTLSHADEARQADPAKTWTYMFQKGQHSPLRADLTQAQDA